MNDKLTLQELIDLLAARHQMEPQDADAFVREFWNSIEEGLKSDNYVKIKGLGTFKLIDTEARESINIQTGERIEIQSHSRVTFSPEASLRDLINRPFAHFETVILSDSVTVEDLAEVDERSEFEEDESIDEHADVSAEEVSATTSEVCAAAPAEEVSATTSEVCAAASESAPEVVEEEEIVQPVLPIDIEEEQPAEEQPSEVTHYSALEEIIEEEQPLEEEQPTEEVHPMVARSVDIPQPIVDIMNEVEAIKPSDMGENLSTENQSVEKTVAVSESVDTVLSTNDPSVNESPSNEVSVNESAVSESADTSLSTNDSSVNEAPSNEALVNESAVSESAESETVVNSTRGKDLESVEETNSDGMSEAELSHESKKESSELSAQPSFESQGELKSEQKKDFEPEQQKVSESPSQKETLSEGQKESKLQVETISVSSQDANRELIAMAVAAQKEKMESERFCSRSKRRLSWCIVACATLLGVVIGGFSTVYLIGTKYDKLISTKTILSVVDKQLKESVPAQDSLKVLVADSLSTSSMVEVAQVSTQAEESIPSTNSLAQSASKASEEVVGSSSQKNQPAVSQKGQFNHPAQSVSESKKKSVMQSSTKPATKPMAKPVAEPVSKASQQQSTYLSEKIEYKIVGTITTCTIRPGQTLTRVALKYYGNKKIWPYLVMHNKKAIKNPDNVPVGTVIKVPKLEPVKSGN